MQSPIKMYLSLVVSLFVISAANGNYGYGQQFTSAQCNRDAYNRAQNSVRLETQQRTPGAPYDSSYSGISNGFQSSNQASSQLDNQCRTVLQSFNDLVTNTPLCESITSYTFQTTVSLIDQGRRFLQQHCERSQGYQHLQCYKGHEVVGCETQFTYARNRASQSTQVNTQVNSGYNPQPSSYSPYSGTVTFELCQTYETFRNCVISTVHRQCYNQDHEYAVTYLVDRARNLAFSCPPYQSSVVNPAINPVINPSIIPGSNFPRRTDLGYPNQNYPNSYPSSYPSNSYSPFSSRQLPTYQLGSNQPGDISRFGGSVVDNVHGICMDRVRPQVDSCRDLMEQRQRDVRHGRSSNDVQRRICCALFWYRDCVSRVVMDNCVDGSRTVVDLLLQDHQRSLATCRDYNREQCSGVSALQGSMVAVLLATLLVSIFH